MAPQDFVLAPCVPEDVEQMIHVYEKAFSHNHLVPYMFPQVTSEDKHEFLRLRYLRSLAKPELRVFKVTEVSTGRMAAWARWRYPYTLSEAEKAEKEQQPQQKREWPRGANVEVCEEKFRSYEGWLEENTNLEDTYLVDLLATDPDFQRKGLATMLLKHGLAAADAEGRTTYIGATPAGRLVYTKVGFRDIDFLTVDLSKWGGEPVDNRMMLRDPQPLSK